MNKELTTIRKEHFEMNTTRYSNLFMLTSLCILQCVFAVHAHAQQTDVEGMLVDFHNAFLPGVDDYQEQIKYPKSPDYYFAWGSLVVAVGQDAALIISVGHSEAAVKLVEGSGTAASIGVDAAKALNKAASGKAGEAIADFAVSQAVDLGVSGVDYAAKKYVGRKIPGVRSAISVIGVSRAGEDEREHVYNAIQENREILEFAREIAPAVVAIRSAIDSIEDDAKRAEYEQMLSAMLRKRAELTVYRQMVQDSRTGDSGLALDQAIDAAIPGRVSRGAYTANMAFVNSVNSYIDGDLSKEAFEVLLEEEIEGRIGQIARTDVKKVLEQVKSNIKEIANARDSVNRYGGGSELAHQPVGNYRALETRIPFAYRLVANLDMTDIPMVVPSDFRSSAPNQGTIVPELSAQYEETTKESAEKLLRDYKSVPGGITLEGKVDFGSVSKVTFLPSMRTFVLDDRRVYRLPVSTDEAIQILRALSDDDRLGVSLAGDLISYGALPRDTSIALNLAIADKLLGHIAFGGQHPDMFAGYKLANGYIPAKNQERLSHSLCVYFRFSDYTFSTQSTRIVKEKSRMTATLVPTSRDVRAEDGGATPDFNAIARGSIPTAYRQNVEHITEHYSYYMREPVLRMVEAYGEMAAFARGLKKAGIDLKSLADSMTTRKQG